MTSLVVNAPDHCSKTPMTPFQRDVLEDMYNKGMTHGKHHLVQEARLKTSLEILQIQRWIHKRNKKMKPNDKPKDKPRLTKGSHHMTGFNLFQSEFGGSGEDLRGNNRAWSDAWKALPEEEKKSYRRRACAINGTSKSLEPDDRSSRRTYLVNQIKKLTIELDALGGVCVMVIGANPGEEALKLCGSRSLTPILEAHDDVLEEIITASNGKRREKKEDRKKLEKEVRAIFRDLYASYMKAPSWKRISPQYSLIKAGKIETRLSGTEVPFTDPADLSRDQLQSVIDNAGVIKLTSYVAADQDQEILDVSNYLVSENLWDTPLELTSSVIVNAPMLADDNETRAEEMNEQRNTFETNRSGDVNEESVDSRVTSEKNKNNEPIDAVMSADDNETRAEEMNEQRNTFETNRPGVDENEKITQEVAAKSNRPTSNYKRRKTLKTNRSGDVNAESVDSRVTSEKNKNNEPINAVMSADDNETRAEKMMPSNHKRRKTIKTNRSREVNAESVEKKAPQMRPMSRVQRRKKDIDVLWTMENGSKTWFRGYISSFGPTKVVIKFKGKKVGQEMTPAQYEEGLKKGTIRTI